MKYLYKLKFGKTTRRISSREWRPILGYIDRLNKLKILKTKKIKKKEDNKRVFHIWQNF